MAQCAHFRSPDLADRRRLVEETGEKIVSLLSREDWRA
jgi:hypothetical protein